MKEVWEKDCRKAYFLEGKIEKFVGQVKVRFLEQERYITVLENKVAQLEVQLNEILGQINQR
jgi:hypothetical protein